jgi:hypothetical protein
MAGETDMTEPNRTHPAGVETPADPLQLIKDALARLRFGAVQLTVHEGKLVQIEVTEKRRFV